MPNITSTAKKIANLIIFLNKEKIIINPNPITMYNTVVSIIFFELC